MRHAIQAARMGIGKTFPNPSVGAVVARDGKIIAVGFHRKAGLPHAEIEAIRLAGKKAKGADLFVTLEPCDHFGKTPPCTDAIIQAGIRRVLVATLDPNPMVNGRGIRKLRRSGIQVKVGLLSKEAQELNYAYFKFMREGKPFITLKVAQTIDGMVAGASGQSKWITSQEARGFARRLRSEAQAIIVGASTIRNDDPMLLPSPRRKTNWMRCVVTTDLDIPLTSRLVRSSKQYKTVAYYVDAPNRRISKLSRSGVILKRVERGQGGVSIEKVIEDLASQGVMHVFVEGGAKVFSSFIRSGLCDRLVVFVAPKVIGGSGISAFAAFETFDLKNAPGFKIKHFERIGGDIMIDLWRE